jgi:hypothetical protein
MDSLEPTELTIIFLMLMVAVSFTLPTYTIPQLCTIFASTLRAYRRTTWACASYALRHLVPSFTLPMI